MKIPQIIHQTWKSATLPKNLSELSATWKKLHPNWEYRLWTDEDNRAFVANHFPDFLSRYDEYPMAIQQVDAVRYLILYTTGGVFIDLDFECLKNMEPLLEGHICVFGTEPAAHCLEHSKSQIISNAWMATAPGHPFFKALIEELYKGTSEIAHRFNRVLETTGPFMLTRVFEHFLNKETISITESEILYPLTKHELNSQQIPARITSQAYAIHHYYGSWWKPQQS